MDVDSVRSGKSERSDRSRRSKRINLPSQSTAAQSFADEQLKLINFRNQTPSSPRDLPAHFNDTITSASGGLTNPRAAFTHAMYNWYPGAQPTNFPNFHLPMQYPSLNWSNQPLLAPSFTQPSNYAGQPIPQLQSQQPFSQSAFLPQLPNQSLLSTPCGNPTSVIGNMPVQNQPTETYRPDHYNRQHQRDDNAWVEEATAVTGATSDTGLSGGDNFSRFGARFGANSTSNCGLSGAAVALIKNELDDFNTFAFSHTLGVFCSLFVVFGALISPLLMLLFPHLPSSLGWHTESCKHKCESHLIAMSVKVILLSLASWILTTPCRPFCMGGSVILPRVRICRTLFLCLVFVVLFAFWLFYTVRIIQPKESDYFSVVLFADNLLDTLLFLHFAGISLIALRKMRYRFAIHIVRSPDGASKTFKCSEMSVQRAAFEVLQFYMIEFNSPVPTQNLGVHAKRGRRGLANDSKNGGTTESKYKFYEVDANSAGDKNGPLGQQANNASNQSVSSRLYEELELEKRTRKRRMRLLVAAEEAFNHARRLATQARSGQLPMSGGPQGNGGIFKNSSIGDKPLDPYEAAQVVFPTLIRPLQKYLRITHQQSRHPVDMVIDHLALSIAYGLSPLAFLQHFNPLATTPQQGAAAAATAIQTAKRDQKLRLRSKPNPSNENNADETTSWPPKHVKQGGQQKWNIIADRALSRSLTDGAIFQLRRDSELSLLCKVRQLPFIYLSEDVLEPLEIGRFVLNTENAV